ncbi:MAG: GumC family protein [Hyphomicrobiaceae bacterium]
MRARLEDPQGHIDISTLPSILRRSAGRLALAAIAVGSITYGALLLVPSRYSSETQVRIGANSVPDVTRGAASAESVALSVDREAIASRVQELRSPDLAKKLASELRLATRPEFNSALDAGGLLGGLMRAVGLAGSRPGESEEERVLAAYYRALQVYQVKDTRVITLNFTARDSQLAAQAANRLVELYQAWLRERGATETSDANAWLVPEIAKRTRELSAAESAVERFRSTANLYRGGGSRPGDLAQQQLVDLASELTKMRAQRSEVEARAQAARDLMSRGVPDAIPDVQKSPVIQALIAQRVRAERDYAEAATQLLPAHPRMKQLAANVADVRRQIQREAGAVVSGLEREAQALALREELQKRTMAEAKSGLGSNAADRVRLAQLEDEVSAKRRELEGLRQRYESSRSRGTSLAVPVEVQVIATARPSSRPSWPNRLQIALLAAAATFVLGLVGVLFRELLSAGSRKAGMVPFRDHRQTSTPVRPAAQSGRHATGASAETEDDAQPEGLALHSVEAVAQRLMTNSAVQSGYRTLIVGEEGRGDPREKASELAGALARAGRKVVLVDWSLDGMGASGGLGIAASPGFTDVVTGSVAFEDAIRSLPGSDVHILPCGNAWTDGVEALGADRMNLVLDALDEIYSDVIITGGYDAARDFFRAIEGRVDAGVLVSIGDAATRPSFGGSAGRRLLGFDVTEIDIIHWQDVSAEPAARPLGRRGSRAAAASKMLSSAR